MLLSPTTPTTAFELGAIHDPLTMYLNDICTIPTNLAGDAAMSVPFGSDAAGAARGRADPGVPPWARSPCSVPAAIEAAAPTRSAATAGKDA